MCVCDMCAIVKNPPSYSVLNSYCWREPTFQEIAEMHFLTVCKAGVAVQNPVSVHLGGASSKTCILALCVDYLSSLFVVCFCLLLLLAFPLIILLWSLLLEVMTILAYFLIILVCSPSFYILFLLIFLLLSSLSLCQSLLIIIFLLLLMMLLFSLFSFSLFRCTRLISFRGGLV